MSTFKSINITETVRIGATPNKYVLPSSDGTNGQIIETDGSGVTTWQTPVSSSKATYTLTDVEIIVTGLDDTPTNFPTTSTITTTGSETFIAGGTIIIAGSTSNDGNYTVVSHVGTTLTVS